jgi:hypothetical protein
VQTHAAARADAFLSQRALQFPAVFSTVLGESHAAVQADDLAQRDLGLAEALQGAHHIPAA